MVTHTMQQRIYYKDTDHAGALYYANYIKIMEVARTELLREHNITFAAFEKQGLLAPVVHLDIDYKASPGYDDLITIETTLEKVGNTSITISYVFKKGETLLAQGKTINVFIDKEKKPVPVPDSIRSLM